MNGRDTKSILLVTLALLTAAYSPLNIYGDKLQDARRWFARGRDVLSTPPRSSSTPTSPS